MCTNTQTGLTPAVVATTTEAGAIIARRAFQKESAVRDFNLDALALIASKPSPPSSSSLELSVSEVLPLDQHPAAVYLARLRKNSRRPQKNALDKIARILSGEEANCFDLDWSRVRYCFVKHEMTDRASLILCEHLLL